MTKEQEAIEKLTNGEKIDFNTLIRKFKKEGIENFVVTKKEYIETVLSMLKENSAEIEQKNTELAEKNAEIEKKDKKLEILEQQYENIKNDFDSYKNNKDINYLDGIHHKKLVEKSIGQIIKKPEECYFDIFEVKVIRNNILYGVAINEDFVSLKQISDESPEECITVIAESPLSGAIYRYNNYGNKEWQLIGTMLGYA